jgi:hypothetical protein
MERLRNFALDLAKSNIELRPLVDNATDHAFRLEEEAEYLKRFVLKIREVVAHNYLTIHLFIVFSIGSHIRILLGNILESMQLYQSFCW